MTAAAIVGVIAASFAGIALVACVLVLRKVKGHERLLDRTIERGRAAFDEVVTQEVERRSSELEATLARARADSISLLAEEERRIAEERRRDVTERERDATARLGQQLMQAQATVEQRLTDWQSDVEKLQQGLDVELKRIEARQRQLMADVESKIGQDAEALQADIEEQRTVIARMRGELKRTAEEVAEQANAELEQHAAERRHALHDVADRLRRRERNLQELVEREGNDAAQRIQLALGDIERRQVEQLQRTVSRETTRYAEAAALSFDGSIKTAREEAARRLSRELDLSVERFARDAESVLTDRLNALTDAASARVEERLSRLRSALEQQSDEALVSLEERAHQVESTLRDRLREIAADAESERAILDSRVHELGRRLDELATRT
ncbi:MAG TPA: hypothetical protein VGI77_00565 [Gaiellaceae bacterium]